MSGSLPVVCRRSGCGAQIGGYDHVCSSQHLQYNVGKLPSVILLASSIVAIHLFHVTGELWPMYLLASMGFAHAFAVAFSRGAALGHAAFYIVSVVLGWLMWELLKWDTFGESSIAIPFQRAKEWAISNPVVPVLGVLIASTLWMYFVGNSTALEGLHETARMYLAVGAFVLCTWGAWGILIQIDQVPNWLVQVSLLVAVISPLAIVFAYTDILVSMDSRLLTLSFWLALITGYLSIARPLVNMVSYFLKELLPRVVGRPPLQGIEESWIIRYSDFSTQASMLLSIVALMSLGAASITRTIDQFQGRVPSWYSEWKENGAKRRSGALTSLLLAPAEWILILANLAFNLALMIIVFVKSIGHNLLVMLRQIPVFVVELLRLLVIPVATFAAISLSFLIALQEIRTYVLGFHASETSVLQGIARNDLFAVVRHARTIWGESVTVMMLALFIGAITFYVANPRFRNEGLAAVCVIVIGYLATTAIGGVLAFMLTSLARRVDLPFGFEEYGDLLRTNIILVGALMVLVVILSLPAAFGGMWTRNQDSKTLSVTMVLVTLPLIAFSGYAMFLGIAPLFGTAIEALGR